MGADEGIKPVTVSDHDTGRKRHGKDNVTISELDFEKGGVETPRYSRLSVWLMVLYSGLAIGSDG